MGALHDDLGGLGEGGNQTAGGDDAEGLGLVGGEAAHPLVQYRGDHHVGIAVLVQVLVRQLLEGADSGHVLDQVAALAIAHGDVLHALLRRQQCLNDGSGMGNAGGHQSAGQGAVGLAVDGHTHLFVQAGQTVHVLPVADGALHGNVLAVGQVIGDAAALVAGETSGIGDLGQQAGVRGAVADLDGGVEALDDLAATGNAVVHRREAVEHGAVQAHGLPDAVLRLLVAVLAGVAVNGGGQQVGLALVLEVLQKLDVLADEGHTRAGLDQSPARLLGVQELFGKDALIRHRLVVIYCFLKVHVLSGGPLGQDFLAQPCELIVRDPLIFQLHISPTPFS